MDQGSIRKRDETTDLSFGVDPYNRPILEHIKNGVVCIDKPRGPTSHQVSAWVKEILNVEKAGHSGTLDPHVSGVLPVGIENGTKVVQILLESSKEYVGIMHLHGEGSKGGIKELFKYFRGDIYQRPPLKSAVKRELRIRRIESLNFIQKKDKDILFIVRCESGTYIRKLCCDMGLVLGIGAHMSELRRTAAGVFTEKDLVTLHDLKDAYELYKERGEEKYLRKCILPVEEAVKGLKGIWVSDNAVDALCHGAMLYAPGVVKLDGGIKKDDYIAIYTLKGELVATARCLRSSIEITEMATGKVAALKRVVMPRGVYPKGWKK